MRFFLGGYGADAGGTAEGIGVLRAGASDDPLAGGDLSFAGTAARAPSPSWLAVHPTLDVLYVAQEHAGTVRAFVRTGAESFAPLGDPADAGALVCHVAVAPGGGSLVASCWGDGRVVHYPLGVDGRLGAPRIAEAAADPYGAEEEGALRELYAEQGMSAAVALPLFGAAPHADAPDPGGEGVGAALPQPGARVSRAHQARFLPGGVIVTTDMGFDLVRFWTAAGGDLRETQRIVLPRGAGPRHTVWHPSGHLYVVTELSHEVYVLAPDGNEPLTRRWRIVAGASLGVGTVAGFDFAAEIALTRDAEFALVDVRGSNTIASLRVRDGGAELAPVALVESGVDWPRHHVIERDTVLVAGQLSQDVAALTLDERTGVPGRVRRRVEAPSPTQLLADRSR